VEFCGHYSRGLRYGLSDEMVKLNILVFKPLAFIMGNPMVYVILHFPCSKIILLETIFLIILHLEKEHCPALNYVHVLTLLYMSCRLWCSVFHCCDKHLRGGKVYFGSQFQRSHTMVGQLCCFRPEARQSRKPHGGRL
jgi:hypothetical protein